MSLDIIAVASEHEQQLRSAISQNVKMAIGLAGAVIMAATMGEKTTLALSEACLALTSFSDCVYSLGCKDETFLAMAADAKKLGSVFGVEGPSRRPPVVSTRKESANISRTARVDVINSIRESLLDESPVTRGGALLDAGRLIRARNVDILVELDKWLFKALKDAVVDSDSYVYLAAINALAEAACYGSTYLRELIALFKSFPRFSITSTNEDLENEAPSAADTHIIIRSRLCEVLGKVFRVLGDMSPVWMDESAGVFLSSLSEDDEIIKASALSSLAELILACRGKNIEKHLEEIFYAVEKLLTSDPSSLVRRSAVNLLRQIIKSCDTALVEIINGRLRDLHRELVRLWRWDSDHVVRLHAELALEELPAWFMSRKVDVAAVAASVQEFYSTTDRQRRKELDDDLCLFKSRYSCDDTIAACILMMGSRYPASVQYFGAISLYETIRLRYEECVANVTLMEVLKSFLIENLTTSAHVQTQSITNKLSSALAMLSLYCMPDVWPDPVATLTNIWAAQPELLLRVLAEIAAEFSNIHMPLTQRSKLKTELHKTSEDIIRIISTVMGAEDASPSTRQAAVECVEQWVKLPGVGLHQWTPVLSVVFGAVSDDSAALTNLLDILAANDELTSIDQLVQDICHYITTTGAQIIATELAQDIHGEDVISLVSAVCTIAVTSVPTLLRHAKQSPALLCELCSLFAKISSCDGAYAVDEMISDLPAPFFMTLREHLGANATGSKHDVLSNVAKAVSPYYAGVCRSAVDKMSYPPADHFDEYDKSQKEQFARYRMARSEVSVDAYFVMGRDTLRFLNQELEASIEKGDVCRTECIMFLWETVADYLSEADYPEICGNLELCTRLSSISEGPDADRLANTTMRLLHALSHLVQEHDDAAELEGHVIRLVLPFVPRKAVSKEALRTLEKYASERSKGIMVILYFINGKRGIHAGITFGCATEGTAIRSHDSPCAIIFRQVFPVFLRIIEIPGVPVALSDKVCDAVRSAISNLPSENLPEALPLVSQLLDHALFTNPTSACALAKSAVLIFGHYAPTTSQLCTSIRQWLESFARNMPFHAIEEWLSLIHQIVKKNYKTLRANGENSLPTISNAILIAGQTLAESHEPCVVRLASQVLAVIATQSISFGDEAPRLLLASHGPVLVKTIFLRIQVELLRPTVEYLAEVLFFFAKEFSQETRFSAVTVMAEFLKIMADGTSEITFPYYIDGYQESPLDASEPVVAYCSDKRKYDRRFAQLQFFLTSNGYQPNVLRKDMGVMPSTLWCGTNQRLQILLIPSAAISPFSILVLFYIRRLELRP
ncbi:Xpo1 domain-containing protein [Trichostrongylus colubriformis]|uniref:Xpo1 domain-containing protein n=1 Tax=Trichostrongylus colubriformis TaxID=6319 RepID=A0AAN8IGY2_TRICO